MGEWHSHTAGLCIHAPAVTGQLVVMCHWLDPFLVCPHHGLSSHFWKGLLRYMPQMCVTCVPVVPPHIMNCLNQFCLSCGIIHGLLSIDLLHPSVYSGHHGVKSLLSGDAFFFIHRPNWRNWFSYSLYVNIWILLFVTVGMLTNKSQKDLQAPVSYNALLSSLSESPSTHPGCEGLWPQGKAKTTSQWKKWCVGIITHEKGENNVPTKCNKHLAVIITGYVSQHSSAVTAEEAYDWASHIFPLSLYMTFPVSILNTGDNP